MRRRKSAIGHGTADYANHWATATASLKEQNGQLCRMTLTYDMTFLAIFLSALYEPAEAHGQMRCLPHPKEAHDFVRTSMTDYAADMTIALAYFKALDDWQDDRSLPGGLTAQLLKKRYEAVSADYPRQCAENYRRIRRLCHGELFAHYADCCTAIPPMRRQTASGR